jgi:hypothetical protein
MYLCVIISVVSWVIKKQHFFSRCSTKAKYKATIKRECEALLPRIIFIDFMFEQRNPTMLSYNNNQGFLKLAKNLLFHACTKYIDVNCHFIKKVVEY